MRIRPGDALGVGGRIRWMALSGALATGGTLAVVPASLFEGQATVASGSLPAPDAGGAVLLDDQASLGAVMPKLQVIVKQGSVNPCQGVHDQHLLDREAMLLHRVEDTHSAVGGVELLLDVAVDLRDEHDAHRVDCPSSIGCIGTPTIDR
jgi:hypothetical protein